jgi:hypothetical protein
MKNRKTHFQWYKSQQGNHYMTMHQLTTWYPEGSQYKSPHQKKNRILRRMRCNPWNRLNLQMCLLRN